MVKRPSRAVLGLIVLFVVGSIILLCLNLYVSAVLKRATQVVPETSTQPRSSTTAAESWKRPAKAPSGTPQEFTSGKPVSIDGVDSVLTDDSDKNPI